MGLKYKTSQLNLIPH